MVSLSAGEFHLLAQLLGYSGQDLIDDLAMVVVPPLASPVPPSTIIPEATASGKMKEVASPSSSSKLVNKETPSSKSKDTHKRLSWADLAEVEEGASASKEVQDGVIPTLTMEGVNNGIIYLNSMATPVKAVADESIRVQNEIPIAPAVKTWAEVAKADEYEDTMDPLQYTPPGLTVKFDKDEWEEGPNGQVIKQPIIYEHLLDKCIKCGLKGHVAEKCRKSGQPQKPATEAHEATTSAEVAVSDDIQLQRNSKPATGESNIVKDVQSESAPSNSGVTPTATSNSGVVPTDPSKSAIISAPAATMNGNNADQGKLHKQQPPKHQPPKQQVNRKDDSKGLQKGEKEFPPDGPKKKDDIMLFCRGDMHSPIILKEYVDKFANASGLRVNTKKSQVFFCRVDPQVKQSLLSRLNFVEGNLPIIDAVRLPHPEIVPSTTELSCSHAIS